MSSRPSGVPQIRHCGVAVLGKGATIPGGLRLALANLRGSESIDITWTGYWPIDRLEFALYSARELQVQSSTMMQAIDTADTSSLGEATDKSGIESLEERIDELIRTCEELREENRALRAQQDHLVVERAALIDKSELARSRVEAMIARLKAMEIGA